MDGDWAVWLEQGISLAIALVAGALSLLAFLAWRRERVRRMAVVAGAYAAFVAFGLLVFLEPYLGRVLDAGTAELIEHAAGLFVLGALVAFFVAIARD